MNRTLHGKRLVTIIGLGITLLFVARADAEPQYEFSCISCHQMPPLDSPDGRRNAENGAVAGSHQRHVASGVSAIGCVACHGPTVSDFGTSHRNGTITMSQNVNNSPLWASYGKGVSFKQSTTPELSVCSSVNCHFESVTPDWGSNPAVISCSSCHSAPPADGGHPSIAGPGTKHGQYLGTGAGSCPYCHPNHLAEASPFAHATSAGRRDLLLTFTGSPNGSVGSYSKSSNLNYPAYLPSQVSAAERNGVCSSSYCHSPGNKKTDFDPPNAAPVWGGTLSCSGCHKDSASDPMVSGSHAAHLAKGLGCAICHAATVSDNSTVMNRLMHVNGGADIAFSAPFMGMIYTPATRSCAGACHSDGRGGAPKTSAVWGTSNSKGCGFCHDFPPSTGAHAAHLPSSLNAGLLPSDYASTAVLSVAGDYVFGCANCHPASLAGHMDGSVEVSLNSLDGGLLKGKNGVTTANDGYIRVAGSSVVCSAAYCHSNGMASSVFSSSPDWYGGSYSGDPCAMCHGNAPNSGGKVGSSPHYNANSQGIGRLGGHFTGIHAASLPGHGDTSISTTISCNICHYATTKAGSNDNFPVCSACHNGTAAPRKGSLMKSDLDLALHLNGRADVVFAPVRIKTSATTSGVLTGWSSASGGSVTTETLDKAVWDGVLKSCANVGCHFLRPTSWSSDGFSCASCHTSHDSTGQTE